MAVSDDKRKGVQASPSPDVVSFPSIFTARINGQMASPLRSLIATGTNLWLDSIDPVLVAASCQSGATGATSNPVIVTNLIKTGRFDDQIEQLVREGEDDTQIAWHMTDRMVKAAQDVFLPIWQQTEGNDGYVSFELDPLLEDPGSAPPHEERVRKYVELGKFWSAGHENRMIKVPATPAGLDALEELAAAGVTLNVTLIFSPRQYEVAREAIWRGVQQRRDLNGFKSVYSIFVSRLDVYTAKAVPQLSSAAQGQVGIVNAKRIWKENRQFWSSRPTKLDQQIVFSSTGTKNPEDDPWKYVEAFAGSDIETNPPETNEAYESSGRTAVSRVDQLPSEEILDEIDREVDLLELEKTLMAEGIKKFADPQKALLALIAEKRASQATS